jgi:hypothetical protein
VEYAAGPPVRQVVGTLADMAISSAGRHSIPWRPYFDAVYDLTGETMSLCTSELQRTAVSYKIPHRVPLRHTRLGQQQKEAPTFHEKTLSSGTIVVVPRNLVGLELTRFT